MPITSIDDIFNQIGGADGWVSGPKSVVLNPTGFPFPQLSLVEEINDTIHLYNHYFETDFQEVVIDSTAEHDIDNEFVLIEFKELAGTPAKLATAGLNWTGPDGNWIGGRIMFYGPNPIWWGANWRNNLRRVLNHEFGHMCGVSHCNSINDSMMNGDKVLDPLNANGFLPCDLAYIQKTLLSYDDGEEGSDIEVYACPSYTKTVRNGLNYQIVYVPYIAHPLSGVPFCGIMVREGNAATTDIPAGSELEEGIPRPVFQMAFWSSFPDLPFPDEWRYVFVSNTDMQDTLDKMTLNDIYVDANQGEISTATFEFLQGTGWLLTELG